LEATYFDVAVRILTTNPDAACILLASVQHAQGSLSSRVDGTVGPKINGELGERCQNEKTLPSWVPDWRWSEGIILAEPIAPHRAHGQSCVKLKIDDRVLKIHGVEIDVVDKCSQPLVTKDFYVKKKPNQPWTTIERLWREICGKEDFNLQERYLDGQAAFFAFMQTFSNGCVQVAGHNLIKYDEVPESVWLSKAARHIVEESEHVSEDIRRVAKDAEGEGDHRRWSRWANGASEHRVFARTKKGYYVLGPKALEEGDIVCVLFGAKVPFCLRRLGNSYLLVGECYVHGLMNGEAMSMLARDEVHKKIFEVV
jgi:hypothetical protein